MALYAIGDLHLSHGTNKPMDVFGGGWVNYTEKIETGFQSLDPEDVCVLCGDTSWGMYFEESINDFLFIEKLPGKKIILKGNHDYWWNTVTKMKAFFDANQITSIEILHNNCFYYGDTAICGTRGWLYDDEFNAGQNKKIMAREVIRLNTSLKAAGEACEKICFFEVGIVVLRSIILVKTPPKVSIPRESGVTSNKRMSLTSPERTPA